MLSFKVGRMVDGEGTPGEANVTPIPGLVVVVEESSDLTPVAVYESRTDNNGQLIDPIVVDSGSALLVYSGSEHAAQFARSGSAVEFSDVYNPAIVATPMVDQAGACLTIEEGTPVAVLRYTTIPKDSSVVEIEVSHLDPAMYRDVSEPDDDLEINSLKDSSGVYQTIAPKYRSSGGAGTSQRFDETGEFSVPYDANSGLDLIWRFLGSETIVNGLTPLCEGGGVLGCEKFPEEDIRSIQNLARETLSRYLAEMWKVMRSNSYGNTSKFKKKVIRFYKKALAESNKLYETYICEDVSEIGPMCSAQPVRKSYYLSLLDNLFSLVPRGGDQRFKKARKSLRKRYQKLFRDRLPDEVWRCDTS